MLRDLIIITILYCFAGCKQAESYADKYGKLTSVSGVYIHINELNTDTALSGHNFPIKYRDSIPGLVRMLNTATIDGPWKGKGWDQITIYTTGDSVIVLNTNGKVFGGSASGDGAGFYKIGSTDFYKNYFGINVKD